MHFQIKRRVNTISASGMPNVSTHLPQLILKDINNDSLSEVLFVPQTESEIGENVIYCFNPAGDELWHYKPGRRLKYGNSE